VTIQKPTQSLESLALIDVRFSPLFFTYFVDSCVKCLDNVKAIQLQRRIGAMRFDRPYLGLAHITATGSDLSLLIITQHAIEEFINGFPAFSFDTEYNT
jgi:hypothetical protein